jgi:hypothetical protein
MKELKMKSSNLLSYVFFLFFCYNISFGQTAAVKFEVKIPQGSLQNNNSIFLAGSFNCWNPHDSLYIMKKAGEDLYSITIPVLDGKKYEYKYTQGDWNSVEISLDSTSIENRHMIARDGLVIKDTVLKWNSIQPSLQKDTALTLSTEQINKLSKIKDEMGKKLQSRMNNANDILKKAIKNMLSGKPDMKLRKKYHNEIVSKVDFALQLAADAMWKVSSMLTPAQKKAVLEELNKPNSSGDIFGLMTKALSLPQK